MPTVPTSPPPGAPPGIEGPVGGTEINSANGWNYLIESLRKRSPHKLHNARKASRAVHTLIRTGR